MKLVDKANQFLLIVASLSSYRCDLKKYEHNLDYDKEDVLAEYKQYGCYSVFKLELVPISKIIIQDIWSEYKIKAIQKAINENKELPPVRLEKENGKYSIIDGIHRVNASIQNGFDYVPAIVSETIFDKPSFDVEN